MKKKTKLSYVYENRNPYSNNVGDCAIRAISKLLDISWEEAYKMLFNTALKRKALATELATIKTALTNANCEIIDFDGVLFGNYPATDEPLIFLLHDKKDNCCHAVYVNGRCYYDTDTIPFDYEVWYVVRKKKYKEIIYKIDETYHRDVF